MANITGYGYFGKKDCEYVKKIYRLFPMKQPQTIVEACMGSGTFIANCGFIGVKRIAVELDKSMFILNRCIKNDVGKLIDEILKSDYSKDTFEKSLEILEEVDKGVVCDDLEVAVATYMSIVLSFNGMRTQFRKTKDNKELNNMITRMYRNAIFNLVKLSKALQGVRILNCSMFRCGKLWCGGQETLVFCDPPYPQSGRGIKTERNKGAGYRCDWKMKEQINFLNYIVKMNKRSDVSRLIICSNIDVDEDGTLLNPEQNLYVKKLLPAGFRMVVIEKKATSEIKSVKSKNRKKRRKAEVIFMNYAYNTEIVGHWYDFEYFDYEDIFGEQEDKILC